MVKFSRAICVLSALIGAAPRSAKALFKASGTKSDKKSKAIDRLDVDVIIAFSGCEYELTVSFKHDDDLPVGGPDTCNSDDLQFADDGLPYLATRYNRYPFEEIIYVETGFASISLDWAACGHPPSGVFTTAHYDAHVYRVPQSVRDGQTCDQPDGAPICTPSVYAQTTDSGRAFFNIGTVWAGLYPDSAPLPQPANMPANFSCDLTAAIPAMGTHCWNFATNPANQTVWDEPSMIMGAYDGGIQFFEPMLPMNFYAGSEDASYSMTGIEYVGQTISTLPTEFSVSYVVATGRSTIVLKGMRASCA